MVLFVPNVPMVPDAETKTQHEAHEGRSSVTAKNLARQKPQPNSEYLAQRRKGRKEIKLPDLAFLASWREQIAVLDSHWPPENLRKPRKLSKIAVAKHVLSNMEARCCVF
jgi:hypothetical protein